MKKFVIIIGALLFAAVFMSGCVTETEDPIVGIWHSETDFSAPEGFDFDYSYHVFNADGTGSSFAHFSGELISGKLDFTWENAGDGKYFFTATDLKGTDNPDSQEFLLEGDTLYQNHPAGLMELHKDTLAEYIPGLWITDKGDYKDHQDIKSMIYFTDDGTGNLIVYSSEVMGLADVFTSAFTWEEKDGSIIITGEKGKTQVFVYENGNLLLDGEDAYHRYTVEDHLYGLWISDKPHVEDGVAYDIVELVKSDGTGVELWTVPDSHIASYRYTFTWETNSPHSYKAVYDDGEVWEFNAVGSQLFDGETWYNKVGFDVLTEYADKVNA